MNQIESELEKMQNNPRKPKSCFISQAVADNTLNDNKIDSQDDDESLKSIENNIDPFDMADPVNILQKIPNSFSSLIVIIWGWPLSQNPKNYSQKAIR